MKVTDILSLYGRQHVPFIINQSRTLGCIRTLESELGFMDVTSVTPDTLRGFRLKRTAAGLAGASVDKELGVFGAALNFARSQGLTSHTVAIPRTRNIRRNRVLSVDDVQNLIGAVRDVRAKVYLGLLFITGQRKEALQTLRRDQIVAGVIEFESDDSVLAQRRKRRARTPVTPAIQGMLDKIEAEFGPTEFIFPGDEGFGNCRFKLDRWLTAACEETGIDASAHVFRHTAATTAIASGLSIWEVSQLLGHSSTRVTEEVYLHRQPQQIKKSVSVLGGMITV